MRARFLAAIASLTFLCGASAHADIYEYSYTGQPFGIDGQNTLPGSTYLSMDFYSISPLLPSTYYDSSSLPFASISMSDGIEAIDPDDRSLLSSSFLETDASGNITAWEVVELVGADRTFVLGDECCTIDDPPVLMSINNNGATDAVILTNGFYGIGPRDDFAYNNGAPGVWAYSLVPEPTGWAMMLVGFCGLGGLMRLRRNATSMTTAGNLD
jgi:hypothetical protein